MPDEHEIDAWPIRLRRRIARRVGIDPRWATLVVVLAGLFTVAFTITLLAVSLETIAKDFHTTTGTMSWAITGPMLGFGVVGPAYGKAGDLWGHKRVYMYGLLGAGVFAALTAVAWSAASMIAFRTLSASAGAATGPAAMAYINRLFGPADRIKPLGYWSFVNAGAPVLGVVAGGVLVDAVGWRAIFAVQAPLCLIGFVVAAWLLPDTERHPGAHFDIAGSLTLGFGAASVLLSINQGSRWGWTSPRTAGLLGFGVALLVTFVRVERRATDPLLPLRWLKQRNIALPMLTQSLLNFAYMGGFLLAPQVLEKVLGLSSGHVGLVVISRPLTFALLAPMAGFITVRVGERITGTTGALLVVGSMVMFVFLGANSAIWYAVIALALSGAGFGISAPALTSLVANAVDPAELGVAGAMQQLMTQLGAVLGSVVMTTVQQAAEPHGLAKSYAPAFVVAAAVAVCAVAVASFVVPSRTLRSRGPRRDQRRFPTPSRRPPPLDERVPG